MQKVKVTRKGQTTIPIEIRERLGIVEGDELIVETTGNSVIFKKIPRIEDCVGMFAGHASVEEIKKEIDKMREEY